MGFRAAPAKIVITGQPEIGQVLAAHAPHGATFQWLRNNNAIPGATASTYMLGPLDSGNEITVRASLDSLEVAVAGAAIPIPGEMEIISQGKPFSATNDFGGQIAAANGVDADFGSTWRSVVAPSSMPQRYAIDISTVPSQDRASVLAILSGLNTPYYQPAGPLGSDGLSQFVSTPRNFTLQASTSTGGGAAPTIGDASWQTLATVTDSRWSFVEQVALDLHAYNWVQWRFTDANGVPGATDDVNVQFQLRKTGTDVWGFAGDSIGMEGARARHIVTGGEWADGALENQVAALTGRTPPVLINLSTAGWRIDLWNTNKATYLNPHPAIRNLILSYGANDVNVAGTDLTALGGVNSTYAQAFKSNYEAAIADAFNRGIQLVVIPLIMWGNTNAWTIPNLGVLNAIIAQLIAENDLVIPGPDFYGYFSQTHTADDGVTTTHLLRDNLHPTYDETDLSGMVGGKTGYAHWRDLWAHWFQEFYT